MSNCPCCSRRLLRCVRKEGIYWFCLHCHQEMPDLSAVADNEHQLELEHLCQLAGEQKAVSLNH